MFFFFFTLITLLWQLIGVAFVHVITALIYVRQGRAGPQHSVNGNQIVSHPHAVWQQRMWSYSIFLRPVRQRKSADSLFSYLDYSVGFKNATMWWITFSSVFTKTTQLWSFPLFTIFTQGRTFNYLFLH